MKRYEKKKIFKKICVFLSTAHDCNTIFSTTVNVFLNILKSQSLRLNSYLEIVQEALWVKTGNQ